MEKVLKSIVIEVPPGKVFGFLSDPSVLPEIWPSMVEVSNAKLAADGAHSFDWTYRMAGVRFHGHSETVEIVPDRFRLVKNTGGIPSAFRWIFEEERGHTKVVLEVEYEMPIPVLGRLAAPFLRRVNEHDGETLLKNLKARLETTEAATK